MPDHPSDAASAVRDRWLRVKTIFSDALDRPPVERTQFIDAACHGDAELLRMVQSLLAGDRAAGSFMEPLDLARPMGAAPAQSLEIQLLLRRRLRIVVLIGLSFNLVFNALRFLRHDLTSAIIWRTIVPGGAYIIVLTVLTAFLWHKRIYTLSQLRRFEAVVFGVTTMYFVADTYNPLFVVPGWLVEYVQRHPRDLSILVRQPSLTWMALIVAYGTFIPNTGRRCAVVTMMMAASPVVTVALAGARHPLIPFRSLFLFLSEMSLWLGMAVAFAVYGSHKIAVLREEAMAARKLGQYQLKRLLGQGGMGEVYLAEHVLLKRPCAVKVIRPDQVGDALTLQRFLREVQVTATLTHPNTIQVFDYGQAPDGTVFYAMEYLDGLSLDELVRRHGRLPPQRVIFLLHQLCGALAEAHRVGLIHRDIKPSNVIVCSRGGMHDIAKLLDFGLARTASLSPRAAGLTQAGLIFGTPAYMSPEQAAGHRTLDGRSDIYSLGALAYFLVTGEPPFVRDTVAQTLTAHITDTVKPLRELTSEVPRDFEEVVMRSLARAPEHRFSDMESVDRALGACPAAGAWREADAATWWSTVSSRVAAV